MDKEFPNIGDIIKCKDFAYGKWSADKKYVNVNSNKWCIFGRAVARQGTAEEIFKCIQATKQRVMSITVDESKDDGVYFHEWGEDEWAVVYAEWDLNNTWLVTAIRLENGKPTTDVIKFYRSGDLVPAEYSINPDHIEKVR